MTEPRASRIVISPANHPRADWDQAFAAMAARGDDKLLDEIRSTKWDDAEWEW